MGLRRTVLGVAAAGTAAGLAGLGLLSVPDGAQAAPKLPSVDAEQLVQSVLTSEPPAMGGTIEVDNQLGLPPVAGVPQLAAGTSTVRVWTDGEGRKRISLPSSGSETTIVDDGTTVWKWDSAKRTVTKFEPGSQHGRADEADQPRRTPDPARAARELVGAVREHSTVSVDGTAEVAGRSAYELVLAPKSGERTLLRSIRVAVDAEHRIPLRLSVYADGMDDPALQVGFSELGVGPQDASLFRFTPPEGARVKEPDTHAAKDPHGAWRYGERPEMKRPTVVGEGWDTVVVADLPKGLAKKSADTDAGERGSGDRTEGPSDPMALAKQFGQRVSGPWGSGWVVTTKVGSALLTSDGRLAVGAVPQQVLTDAVDRAR